MGVLTHLDGFRNPTTLRRVKKQLKQRFWTDIYEGCKLFHPSGLKHGRRHVIESHAKDGERWDSLIRISGNRCKHLHHLRVIARYR